MVRARLIATVVAVLLLAAVEAEAQRLRLPEPVAPEPEIVAEVGESPVYYRLEDDVLRANARTALGTTWRSDEGNGLSGWGFSLDLTLGAEIGFGRGSRLGVLLEGGYGYINEDEHLFLAGAGLFLRRFGPAVFDDEEELRPQGDLYIVLIPHAVVGRSANQLAVGLRTSLVFGFWMYCLVLSHQWLRREGEDVHEVQIAAGFTWRTE